MELRNFRLFVVTGLVPFFVVRPTYGEVCCAGGNLCSVDGTGCNAKAVEFMPYSMAVSSWDNVSKKTHATGQITSYAITGKADTWQMYLHGPLIRRKKRGNALAMPSVYVFATFTNQIYLFENFTMPVTSGQPAQPLQATQKVVGRAEAPSTGHMLHQQTSDGSNEEMGLLVAEGQPFYLSNIDTIPPHEVNLGGVQFLPVSAPGHGPANCTKIFPTDWHRRKGQVVNTVNCHDATGICFFSVWKFFDDQSPIWNKAVEVLDNDCLYYCMLDAGSDAAAPNCTKAAVVTDEHGHPICHTAGIGAVHGLEIGNTDPEDPTKFDLLLVFTGKATIDNGESSMLKVTVQAKGSGDSRSLEVLGSKKFGVDLFQHYAPKGWDVGGDHAWVDETGKYVWVSCFRSHGVGVHMLDYDSGALIHSITGLHEYVPGQYTYTAGIHGIGTLGKPGSYLVIATCSCKSLKMCIPTVPWHWPVPPNMWTTGVFFIIDLSSMTLSTQVIHV